MHPHRNTQKWQKNTRAICSTTCIYPLLAKRVTAPFPTTMHQTHTRQEPAAAARLSCSLSFSLREFRLRVTINDDIFCLHYRTGNYPFLGRNCARFYDTWYPFWAINRFALSLCYPPLFLHYQNGLWYVICMLFCFSVNESNTNNTQQLNGCSRRNVYYAGLGRLVGGDREDGAREENVP